MPETPTETAPPPQPIPDPDPGTTQPLPPHDPGRGDQEGPDLSGAFASMAEPAAHDPTGVTGAVVAAFGPVGREDSLRVEALEPAITVAVGHPPQPADVAVATALATAFAAPMPSTGRTHKGPIDAAFAGI